MLLGAYDPKSAACLLEAMIQQVSPGGKIVVMSAAYRQAKRAVSVLADSAGVGLEGDCEVEIHGRKVVAVPIRDGHGARGLAADLIVLVENFSIPREVVETVIRGR